MSGPVVKSPIWPRMGKGFCATRKMSFLLLSQDCLQAPAQVRLLHRSRRTNRVPFRVQQNFEVTILTLKRRETETILQKSKKKKTENEDNNQGTRDRLRNLPDWLEEFTDNLEDAEVPALANTSHDWNVLWKRHPGSIAFIFTAQKTEIAKSASEPRLQGVLEGSELVKQSTAEHKVLTEGGEFWNDHKYAVVVQDLATQWIQSYSCKKKTSHKTERSLRKFFEPSEKPESHLYQQITGIWQVLWRLLIESLYFTTPFDPRRME